MNENNELEDLEFSDFYGSITISEETFDTIELNQSVSKPAVRLYSFVDEINDFPFELDILLDLPKAIQLREWLDKFIQKHNKDIQSNE